MFKLYYYFCVSLTSKTSPSAFIVVAVSAVMVSPSSIVFRRLRSFLAALPSFLRPIKPYIPKPKLTI